MVQSNTYNSLFSKDYGTKIPDDIQLIDENGELTIKLKGPNGERSSVVFESYVSFRKIGESDAYNIIGNLMKNSGASHLVYQVEGSDFKKWFDHENQDVRTKEEIKHFCVATFSSIIDVLSSAPPQIKNHI